MTDVNNNTLGSAVGVMIFRHEVVHAMLAVAGLRIGNSNVDPKLVRRNNQSVG